MSRLCVCVCVSACICIFKWETWRGETGTDCFQPSANFTAPRQKTKWLYIKISTKELDSLVWDINYTVCSRWAIQPMLIWSQPCLPMYVLPRPSSQCQPPPAPASSQPPVWTNQFTFISALCLRSTISFSQRRTKTLCSKHEADGNFQEFIKKKITKQNNLPYRKKSCANFHYPT